MKDISEATNPALRGSLAALRRAAEEARRIAIQTGTDLIVFRNGEITRIPPQELMCSPAAGTHSQSQETPVVKSARSRG